jgi:putative CocE/NonD family hydrolase
MSICSDHPGQRRTLRGLARLAATLAIVTMAMPLRAAEPSGHWDEALLSQPKYEVLQENLVPVRMRDGTLLSADIYRPDAPGRFPVLLWRTPYSNNTADSVEQSKWYAARGYVVVVQDVRGKYDSGGAYTLFRDELDDGYDTDEWIGQQPWSNGRIGTMGGSYVGYTQVTQGIAGNRYLTSMASSVTTGDAYNGWVYSDGALFLGFALSWGAVDMDGRSFQYQKAYDWPAVYRHLPIATMDAAAGHVNPGFREWLQHPRAGDPFWKGVSFESDVHKVAVPWLVVEGWYDLFLRGALADHVKVVTQGATALARAQKRLLIGPWVHGTGGRNNAPGSPTEGADRSVDFGPDAEMELRKYYLRWNDHWLKGIDNGVDREPPIKIFVMGENRWRFENEWPLARTQYTKYYLSSGGRANSAAGDGSLSGRLPAGAESDRFTHDPADPVPTLGGNICCSQTRGPWDQRKVEIRRDVLVYTTPVLEQPLEVTGPISVTLFASTSARDTDWTAKLVDVHPDGYAQNIQDGIVRARYRKGRDAPAELLEPGRVYEYQIDLWATSNTFLPGHRIRLEVASSNFPHFDRNLNTGEDPMTGTRIEAAQQTVYHSAKYASHVVLPIIPRGKASP